MRFRVSVVCSSFSSLKKNEKNKQGDDAKVYLDECVLTVSHHASWSESLYATTAVVAQAARKAMTSIALIVFLENRNLLLIRKNGVCYVDGQINERVDIFLKENRMSSIFTLSRGISHEDISHLSSDIHICRSEEATQCAYSFESSVVLSLFLSFSRGKARRRDFESTFSLILSTRSNLFRRISHLINAIVGEESPEKGAEGENDDPVDVAQTPPEGLLRCQQWHGRRGPRRPYLPRRRSTRGLT